MSIKRYLYWPVDTLDRWLDQISVYRLVLYVLYFYLVAAVFFSLFSEVPFKPYYILASAIWLQAVCRGANWLLAKAYKVPANQESSLITGLILTLILSPPSTIHGFWILTLVGSLAMASKYLITVNRRHIFNPAAVGAVMSIVLFQNYASWWIGSKVMAPLIILTGILILRKINRFKMVGLFFAVYLFILWLTTNNLTGHSLWLNISATPILFFAVIMLTEPLTTPTELDKSLIYAGVVGLFYSISRLHVTPEEALLIGNLLTFVMTPDSSLILTFTGSRPEAADIISYVFKTPKRVKFKAGQYLRWTLPNLASDARGNRRYFTISAAPTEKELMFTVKQPPQPSGFKQRLTQLKPGDQILATQLAGDFILPQMRVKKLAFLAGGVGITPFRSMIKEMVDRDRGRDIVMFYGVNDKQEIAFEPLFSKAKLLGLKTFYAIASAVQNNDNFLAGRLDRNIMTTYMPDWQERVFFISGPQGFVSAMRNELLDLGIPRRNIHTDFFPGYN